MARCKTNIKVDEVKSKINSILANDETPEETRKAMCNLLESILFDANRYGGYGYVDWLNDGFQMWVESGQPEDKRPFLGPEYKREYF